MGDEQVVILVEPSKIVWRWMRFLLQLEFVDGIGSYHIFPASGVYHELADLSIDCTA